MLKIDGYISENNILLLTLICICNSKHPIDHLGSVSTTRGGEDKIQTLNMFLELKYDKRVHCNPKFNCGYELVLVECKLDINNQLNLGSINANWSIGHIIKQSIKLVGAIKLIDISY